ncbi:MAG: DUF1049 domain-containing protein [Spirochaetales bacterium]|nr:DUF1049 domain-containing protein [Spirochaetales bacterium]
MVRLVFSIVFLVILAVFIAFNAHFNTDVNLFGYKMTGVPTVAVVLLTLVAGVLYSFGLYLIAYFSKRRAGKAKELKRKNAEKTKELKSQEEELKTAKASLNTADEAGASVGGLLAQPRKKTRGIFKGLGKKSKRR